MYDLLIPHRSRQIRLACETVIRTLSPLAEKTKNVASALFESALPFFVDAVQSASYIMQKKLYEFVMGGRYPFTPNGRLLTE